MKFEASNIKMPAKCHLSTVWFKCVGTIPVVAALFLDELQPLGHGTYQER